MTFVPKALRKKHMWDYAIEHEQNARYWEAVKERWSNIEKIRVGKKTKRDDNSQEAKGDH